MMDGSTPTSRRAGAEPGPAWQALHAATAGLHAQVEALPLMRALMSPTVDAATCIGVLQGLLAAHAVWEQANAAWLRALAWPWQPRAPRLQRDLLALDAPLPAGSPPAPRASCAEEAWGMLYVVEGSALGGRLIARHLRARLPQLAARICHFDADPGPGWPAFRTALEQALPANPARQQAAAAARAMFTHFHHCLATAARQQETACA